MEQIFNKLVRDNIPSIIKQNGEEPITKTLDYEEYKKELYKKLLEEANEVINAQDKDALLEELADVFEILKAIAESVGKNINDVEEIANQKSLKRGGFSKRIFLEKTYK